MSIETSATSYQSLTSIVAENIPLWFQQGGTMGMIMWLLLLLSFVTTVVTLERLFFWAIYYFQRERFTLQECFAALNKHQKTDALLACQKIPTPALKMLAHGIEGLPTSPTEKMHAYAAIQINKLSRGQSLLRTIAIISPILGVIGALLFFIEVLPVIAVENSSNNQALLVVTSQALIPVATSLIVMTLALLPYHLFGVFINTLRLHLATILAQFNHLCQQQSLINSTTNKAMQSVNSAQQKNVTENIQNDPVSEQTSMPYHYEFSKETGEVNVTIHPQTEDIKRVSSSSIAKMYAQTLTPTNANTDEKPILKK
ncbi:MotA/TolQ/ExbB proton channel family protein [Psychromonas sp. SR45-3]|uniref:MotA/TolQ/ExbB proton channel family protein n=1 Tax=Psychromonas sp. SR45-3 TaxID=2760930 RepID=UPI0015F924DA|nr:MotA/TolQ/ExbB proton channel family protein [Psychromonas sp. SR45-3]MBB1273688.1 MotA/TolQ/ExbB proton channel family protein [Psychromonas sp. SR45-3]